MISKLDDILFFLRNVLNIVFGIIFGIPFCFFYAPFFLMKMMSYGIEILTAAPNPLSGGFLLLPMIFGVIIDAIFSTPVMAMIVVAASSYIIKTKTPSFPQIVLRVLVVILSVIGLFKVGIPHFYSIRRIFDLASVIDILLDSSNVFYFLYFIFCTIFCLYISRGVLGLAFGMESHAELFSEQTHDNKNDKPL
ncbi:MAG: hypothetical protein LBG16_03635 [Elusimicrobiota bacterium]|jgi:hypothetical protein|nr:hypothetical protein [Elusimicrobiota bacterium]